jgi:hypothetical protein
LEYLVNRIVATADTADTEENQKDQEESLSPQSSLSLCGSVAKPLSQLCAFSVRVRAYFTAKREEFLEMNFILQRGVVVVGLRGGNRPSLLKP